MDSEIKVLYKGYTAIYYTDYMRDVDWEYEFYNYEIWKGEKYLLHATIEKSLTEAELMDILKNYVDTNLTKMLLEEDTRND